MEPMIKMTAEEIENDAHIAAKKHSFKELKTIEEYLSNVGAILSDEKK